MTKQRIARGPRRPSNPSSASAARPSGGARSVAGAALPLGMLVLGAGGSYLVLMSCGRAGDPPQPAHSSSATAGGAAADRPTPLGGKGLIDPSDGGGNNLIAIPSDAFVDDRDAGAATPTGPLLGAAHFVTHVFERPDYSSPRVGYLRAGAKVPILGAVTGEPVKRIKTPSCREGWVAIVPRGFVCLEKGGGALNLEQPNVRLATAPPNFDDLLPYKYAVTWRNGAPLYRKVPTPKEWSEKEPWLRPPPKKKPKSTKSTNDDDPYDNAKSPSGAGDDGSDHDAVSERDILDAGASTARAVSDSSPSLPPLLPEGTSEDTDAGPWWERDAGKGSISLKDTMEAEGLVARRMAKGFFISIDRTFSWNNRAWHRTTMGLVAPADAVMITKSPEFKGVELGTEWQLPIAWSLVKEAGIYESKDKKSFAIRDRFKRQTPLRLLSPAAPGYEEVKAGGQLYVPTIDGRWVRAHDVARIDAARPPADLKPGEKWIDVSIKAQALVAYEGEKPVYATLVSTGRDGTNVKGPFATVQGTFRVREKHVAATMDGDTSGELYSIDDVPYIQYFHASYALHGAFWHSDYGRVRSHGCVNLAPADAKRLFFWTEPRLPDHWHGVWATESQPGTRIVTRP